jgi:hypothetical protein
VLPSFVDDLYTEYRASAAIPAAIVSRVSGTFAGHCTAAVNYSFFGSASDGGIATS